MASRSSSTVWALLTPTDEPMFAGLTKHGSPSSATSSFGQARACSSCSAKAR